MAELFPIKIKKEIYMFRIFKKYLQATILSTIAIATIGCTTAQTHTNLAEGAPSAKIKFELLTSDSAGGGHLGVSTDAACKKATRISDYTRISDFRKGHTFRDDVDKFEASIPAEKEVQLYGRVLAPHFSCDTKIIFVPEVGAEYLVTYAYKLPGCQLRVYQLTDGLTKPVDIHECR